MRIWIQCDHRGLPYNINAFNAMIGFEEMGFEIKCFHRHDVSQVEEGDLLVGGIGVVRRYLTDHGYAFEEITYPAELKDYYMRHIFVSTAAEVCAHPHWWPIFMKPVEGKKFNGFVLKTQSDLAGRITPGEEIDVFCSEPIDILSEWRCFVRYGEILDIRRYKGALGISFDYEFVKQAVAAYRSAPAANSLDIGVSADGKTVVVEVNDGYSLGSYGLDPLLYAKLLSARWSQLIGREDPCAF